MVGALALSISSLVVGSVATIASPTPAYAASKKSSKKSKKDPLKGVKVKKKVDKYSWAELAKISDAMTESGSRKAALKIAKKYKLCDKKGKLDGSQTKSVALSTGKTSVRIVGFYHDDLSDGSGKAGITWQFVDGMCNAPYMAENGGRGVDNFKLMDTTMQGLATDSWLPSDITSRLATVSVKTASADSVKNGETVASDAKLWAPSATEILGDAKDMAGINRDTEWMANALNAEGAQYDLFKDQGLSWDDQWGAFSDYPTSYFYTCDYIGDAVDKGANGMEMPYVKEGATPTLVSDSNSDDDQCVTVYRSLYLNPKTPDENFNNYAMAMGQSKIAGPGRYQALGTVGDKVTQPLFCLTAAADEDSAAAESNGIAIQDSVDNYSWSDLKAIADEIADAANNGGDPYAVAAKYHLGDEDGAPTASSYKTVELKNGVTAKAYIVDYGCDDRADGKGKAGITFLFDDVAPFEASMNKDGANSGGWKDSDLRKTLNKQFIKKLPKDLKNSIVKVKKLTNNSGVTTDVSSVTETKDALWLPSAMEIFGTTDIEDETNGLIKRQPDQVPVYEAEGKSYTLYQLTKLLYRYDNGYPTAWTRSCDASQSGAFIAYNGFDLCSGVDADEAYAVFPGFCL
ncbi:DUF6273 domain-containing protein [Collinsella aerofaciens]|uniref:DUF6273 domain-containing protein n=1 Tax=Collinsella aerofaciens TaxID=74426 RepID=UPI00359C98A0